MPAAKTGPGEVALAEPGAGGILEQLPQGVVLVDRDLVVEYANRAAERLLGGTPKRGDPLPDPWPDFPLRTLAERLYGSSPPTVGSLVHTRDRTLWVVGVPPSGMGHAILTIDDVTDRERTRQSERRFAENAAHELRTPLTAIVSVIDVLESGAKEVPEVRDRFLAHLRAHSERLSRLATSLLILARVQTRQERPRLELVPVEPLLEEVAAGLVTAEGVVVEVDAPDHIAALADRDLLYQALENVAANASKHTQKGEIVFEARDLGRTVEIGVRDTGTGMGREDAARAFNRFYRGSEGAGFGLGLAIADEAVQALGGTITLDSKPAVGTHVRLRVPRAQIVS